MRLRTPTTVLLVLAAGLGAGCGSDEEPKPSIPADAADFLQERLTSVQNRFNFGGGACNDIPKDQRLVNDQIARLPASVDSDVRNALQDSFDHLFDLTADQCDKSKGEDTDTETEPTETTETETEPTDTTETETEPTETTETETTPTDTTPTETNTTPTTPPDSGTGGGAEGPGS